MTEDEAKKKWCHRAPRIFQTIDQAEHSMFCLGSSCMAWRWSVQNNETGEVVQQQSRVAAEFLLKVVDFEASIGGYCGLAGKP